MSGFKIQGEDLDRRYVTEYELVDYFQNSFTAWGFGSGVNGKLGDGTTVNKSSPVSVLNTLGGSWKQVGATSTHALAISDNGTAWAWGDAASGCLGDNSVVDKSSPVSVVGGILWKNVAVRTTGGYGISQQGIWYSWGQGSSGALGDNSAVNKSSPVTVSGGGIGWIHVSGGNAGGWALKNDGTIWSVGSNAQGQLGDGTTVDKSSPVSVIGGITDWVKLATTDGLNSNIFAIRSDGTLWGWGAGSSGTLGNLSTVNRSSPVTVAGGFTDWTQVATGGGSNGAAIRKNGTLWTWGINTSGRLGDNSVTSKSSPVSIANGGTNWKQVSCGGATMAAVKTDGTLWTWGDNDLGQLGDGTTISKSSPVNVAQGISWIKVSTIAFSTNSEITLGIGV